VGMGADLFVHRPDLLGERADAILGWSLQTLCLGGPDEELTRTEHAQPALFALSYALWEELVRVLPHAPAASAGHSLGEYTALVAAGALGFDDALAVVSERGRAMASAADLEPSGMAALLGADLALAESVCAARAAEGGRLVVANINGGGQVVVAGGASDLDWLEAHGRRLGVRKSVRLKVAGAFHSPFMQPAAERVARAVAAVPFTNPIFPVYGNVTAAPVAGSELRDLLARQVVSPVRFEDTLRAMSAAGIDTFVHVGPGDVTAGMAKRVVDGARVVTVNELASIGQAVETLFSIADSEGEP
jgi:[acyl-carrier-protein] S-malonyltransferase